MGNVYLRGYSGTRSWNPEQKQNAGSGSGSIWEGNELVMFPVKTPLQTELCGISD